MRKIVILSCVLFLLFIACKKKNNVVGEEEKTPNDQPAMPSSVK